MTELDEGERFPEFAKLEKIPGVDYGVHGMWEGTVKASEPETWKANCEADPKRNPSLSKGKTR